MTMHARLFFAASLVAIATLIYACGGAAPMQKGSADSAKERLAPSVDGAGTGAAGDEITGEKKIMEMPSSVNGGATGARTTTDTLTDAREELDRLVADIDSMDQTLAGTGVADVAPRAPRTCAETCELSEGICRSSSRICDIAEGRPSETYFAERCAWSGKTCAAAKQRCETCSP